MKVVIIGLGSIGKKHLKAMRSLSYDWNIFALRSSAQSENLEGVTNLYSWEELDGSFDLAIIANPTFMHAESIRQLSQHKIPLFIEKPAVLDLDEGKKLLDSLEQKGIFSYVACNLRFLDSIKFIRETLLENQPKINEVNAYAGSYLPDWRPGRNFREVYSARPERGGGVHLDLIHELDYLYWMFGKGAESRSFFSSKSHLEIRAIDYANYQLIYPDFLAQVTLNYFRKSAKRTLEILTDAGTYKVDLLNNSVYLESQLIFHSEQKILDTYPAQIEYVCKCLENKQVSFNSLRNGIEVLEICLNPKRHDSFA